MVRPFALRTLDYPIEELQDNCSDLIVQGAMTHRHHCAGLRTGELVKSEQFVCCFCFFVAVASAGVVCLHVGVGIGAFSDNGL